MSRAAPPSVARFLAQPRLPTLLPLLPLQRILSVTGRSS
jgi:hypothetical protein